MSGEQSGSGDAKRQTEGEGVVKKSLAPRTFADFDRREAEVVRDRRRSDFEQATRELTFTKDFNSRLEVVIEDPLETIGARVLAWMKRMSWGNNCLYCVKSPDGPPAFQVDCAEDLGVDKRRVSAAIAYYRKRGYLRVHGSAKVLYLVISPALAKPPDPDEKSEEYRTFFEEWKVAHSADFQQLEVARSTVKTIRKVLLSRFKKWRASRTKTGCYKEERLERLTAAAGAAASGLPEEPAAAVLDPTPQEDAEILQALSQYGNTDLETARKIKLQCRDRYPDATTEEVIQKIHEKGTQRGKRTSPIGFLVVVVPKSFEGYVRPKPSPPVSKQPSHPLCLKCKGYGMVDFSWYSFEEVKAAIDRGVETCDCQYGESVRKMITEHLSP